MPTVTLPDGKTKSFDKPVTGLEVAQSIGAGLAKAALAIKIDGETRDLATVIDRDTKVALITTPKAGQPTSPEALAVIRHSAAHVMAEAIQDVVGKDVQLAYGPPTETGFSTTCTSPRGSRCRRISSTRSTCASRRSSRKAGRLPVTSVPPSEGLKKLRTEANKYKLDNAERCWACRRRCTRAKAAGAPAVGSESRPTRLSFYVTGAPGKNWKTSAAGRTSNTAHRAARVMSVASSNWHGDVKSDRLIRVYGTAFFDKKSSTRTSSSSTRRRSATTA